MKTLLDIKKFKFYLRVGLAWLFLQLFIGLIRYPGKFWAWTLNEIWWTAYIVVLHFILFEYSIPFIGRKRKSIFYNILLGLVIVWVHLMLYSFGLYAWRFIGIRLHIYTAL